MNTQTGSRRRAGNGALYALFAEPCPGTHTCGGAVLLLGIRVDPQQLVKILGLDAEDQPRWFGLDEVTFDWRPSPICGLGAADHDRHDHATDSGSSANTPTD